VRTPPLRRGRGFVLPFSGGQQHPYYGCHKQSAAQLHPCHDRLGVQHHTIKKSLHAKNLPFAFEELYEIRASRSYRPRPGPNTFHQ
jgi:hypothetical protein